MQNYLKYYPVFITAQQLKDTSRSKRIVLPASVPDTYWQYIVMGFHRNSFLFAGGMQHGKPPSSRRKAKARL
jgi:hypothetical protein